MENNKKKKTSSSKIVTIILLVLAVINYFLSDALGSYIIIGVAIVSALIRYFQDYSVYKFNQKLRTLCIYEH